MAIVSPVSYIYFPVLDLPRHCHHKENRTADHLTIPKGSDQYTFPSRATPKPQNRVTEVIGLEVYALVRQAQPRT